MRPVGTARDDSAGPADHGFDLEDDSVLLHLVDDVRAAASDLPDELTTDAMTYADVVQVEAGQSNDTMRTTALDRLRVIAVSSDATPFQMAVTALAEHLLAS